MELPLCTGASEAHRCVTGFQNGKCRLFCNRCYFILPASAHIPVGDKVLHAAWKLLEEHCHIWAAPQEWGCSKGPAAGVVGVTSRLGTGEMAGMASSLSRWPLCKCSVECVTQVLPYILTHPTTKKAKRFGISALPPHIPLRSQVGHLYFQIGLDGDCYLIRLHRLIITNTLCCLPARRFPVLVLPWSLTDIAVTSVWTMKLWVTEFSVR